jgi:hypothetical protein
MQMDDEEMDIDLKKLKEVFKRLTIYDYGVVCLLILMAILYYLHTVQIAECNAYYQEIIENMRYNYTYLRW